MSGGQAHGREMLEAEAEILAGRRFAFGRNWSRFLAVLDDERVTEAMQSLQKMMGRERLDGLSFLDVGSGSGLFSLAAWQLGASVYSFDYDAQSVANTKELCRRQEGTERSWQVEQGSVLDAAYLRALGQFDIVYSWGVLHHTGKMWEAMDNVAKLVAPQGQLFIALYNDQDLVSRFWYWVKRFYCSGSVGRAVVIPLFFMVFAGAGFVSDVLRRRNPLRRYAEYRLKRGMSLMHDWIDWLGGYPYEVAKPGDVFQFYAKKGFRLQALVTRPTLGCNEYVFVCEREGSESPRGPDAA